MADYTITRYGTGFQINPNGLSWGAGQKITFQNQTGTDVKVYLWNNAGRLGGVAAPGVLDTSASFSVPYSTTSDTPKTVFQTGAWGFYKMQVETGPEIDIGIQHFVIDGSGKLNEIPLPPEGNPPIFDRTNGPTTCNIRCANANVNLYAFVKDTTSPTVSLFGTDPLALRQYDNPNVAIVNWPDNDTIYVLSTTNPPPVFDPAQGVRGLIKVKGTKGL